MKIIINISFFKEKGNNRDSFIFSFRNSVLVWILVFHSFLFLLSFNPYSFLVLYCPHSIMESSLLNYNFTVLILFPSGCFSTHFIFLLIFYSLACHHPQSRWLIQDLGEDQGSTKVPFFSREKSTHISNWMAKELWIQWCMLCYSHRPLWNTDLYCVWYYNWKWCSFLYRRVFFVLSMLLC